MIKPWRTGERRVLLDRKPWFKVGEETVELPSGEVVQDFGFIDMLDFAVIVPITGSGETILVDPNYGCGAMHAFIAHGARRVREPESGDLEEQELLVVPIAEAIARLQAGEISHLASAAAVGLAAIALDGSR